MTVGIYHFSISISFITEHTIISLPCMLRRVARKTYHSFKQARMSSNDSHKQAIPSTVFDTAPEKTLFNKFVTGEFKCNKVYEDDHVLAFHDINPQAPTHILIIPKIKKIGRVHEATDADAAELGQLFIAAGYRLVVNQGHQAQQSVNYLHVHLLAGRQFTWPPG